MTMILSSYTVASGMIKDSLTRSIVATVTAFFLLQAGLFSALCLYNGIQLRDQLPFFLTSLAAHGIILAFLLVLKADFYVESSGKKLGRVNLANILTLIRISSLPTILFLILGSLGRPIPPLLFILIALVFLTDLLDGMVCRVMKQGTKIGRMLDSFSDYCLLIVLSIVLYAYRLIHPWYFGIILGRLFFQALGMAIFFLAGKPLEPRPTLFGKIAVASTMILYALGILNGFFRPRFDTAFLALEITAAVLLCVSVIDKALVFIRHISGASRSS